MKLYIKFLTGITTVLAVTGMTFTTVSAAQNVVFSDVVANKAENNKIPDVMPLKNIGENAYATCTVSTDMKAEASNSSEKIRLLPVGYNLSVLGTESEWVYVQDDEGKKGYVYYTNVTFKNGDKPSNTNPMEELGKNMVNFSKKYLGVPYVWGGTSLTSGVDCSGFIYCIYKNFGITLNRNSSVMYSSNGVPVNKNELRAGDLVFFNTLGNGISHVGMYIGNGQYIHAISESVRISDLSDSYSTKTYVGARRILV